MSSSAEKGYGGEEPAETRGGSAILSGFKLTLTIFWLLIGTAGWILAFCGLSALQNSFNEDGVPPFQASANYPALPSSQMLRFEWFVLFLNLVVGCLAILILISRALPQARAAIIGYIAVSTVLLVISTNNLLNICHFATGSTYQRARTAFVGFLLQATAKFGLSYMLGISSEPVF